MVQKVIVVVGWQLNFNRPFRLVETLVWERSLTITCSIVGCKCIVQLANIFLCRKIIPGEQPGAGAGADAGPAVPPAQGRHRQRDCQALHSCQVTVKPPMSSQMLNWPIIKQRLECERTIQMEVFQLWSIQLRQWNRFYFIIKLF